MNPSFQPISAWSFVVEPHDLWIRRIHRDHLAAAPWIETGASGSRLCAGRDGRRFPLISPPWIGAPASGCEPQARLDALRSAGVQAEIIYPTFAWHIFQIEDEDLKVACLQAYNDWIRDFTATAPLRFYGAGLVGSGPNGAVELERCVAMGMKTVVVELEKGESQPVLEVAAELGTPVIVHRPGPVTPATDLAAYTQQSIGTAAALVGDGMLQRLPSLQLVVMGERLPSGRGHVRRVVARAKGTLDAEQDLRLWASGLGGADAGAGEDVAFGRDNAILLYGLPAEDPDPLASAAARRRIGEILTAPLPGRKLPT